MSELRRDDPTRRQDRLEERVARLEQWAVQAVAWVAGSALVLGALLPYLPVSDTPAELEGEETGDHLNSLLTAGFQLVGWRNRDGDGDGFAVTVGIGFLGLMVVTAVALVQLYVIGSHPGERTLLVAKTCGVMMLIGVVVAGILVLMFNGSEERDGLDPGWGPAVYLLGVASCWVLLSSRMREWWEPDVRT